MGFCGACKNYKKMPDRIDIINYPWGGYDTIEVEQGLCEILETLVVGSYPADDCNFFDKED